MLCSHWGACTPLQKMPQQTDSPVLCFSFPCAKNCLLVCQALVALRDYLPLHIYHHASNHLFGMDELNESASLMPQLRPELSNLRAYAAGNIEVGWRGRLAMACPALPCPALPCPALSQSPGCMRAAADSV